MTPQELEKAVNDFYTKADQDPVWLITCMQDTKYDLHAKHCLTFMVYVQAHREGCHNCEKEPMEMHEQLTQWLIDMHEAGEGVTFATLMRLSHMRWYIAQIRVTWRVWLVGQLSGRYFNPKGNWVYVDDAVLDTPCGTPEALCSA